MASCPCEMPAHMPKIRSGFYMRDLEEDSRGHRNSQPGKRKSMLGIEIVDRAPWAGRQDYLFSMIAYAVGLGNIWRFPYLCYKNGGGAFLIAYIACFTLIALPMFVIEVAVGQYLQTGALRMWKICPLFRGVGIGTAIMSLMCMSYFCVIVSWALFYLVSSFNLTFPWETCDNFWNTATCISGDENTTTISNLTKYLSGKPLETAVEQFWERRVLQLSPIITDFSGIQGELFVLLLFAWLVVYFCLWNGSTETRRFVYFCSLFPYFLITILLIRGLTLPGASIGVNYFFTPNTTALYEMAIWKDAGTQVLYSYGIGFGTLIALGSHNKFNHNCYRDAFIMCFINAGTSICAGLVVFSVLGYMATIAGRDIAEIVKPSVGLIFVVFPEISRHLPLKQIWSASVFFMLVILGLDTQVYILENIFVSLEDKFPFLLHKHRKVSLLLICILLFLIGIPMISFSGIYWLTLVDFYGASGLSLLFVVFFEVIGIAWSFGTDNVRFGIYEMTGIQISRLWKLLWNFTTPLSIAALFVLCIINYKTFQYHGDISYPYWAEYIGFYLSLFSMIPIPLYAIYYLCCKNRQQSFLSRLKKGISPPSDSSLARMTSNGNVIEKSKFLEKTAENNL